MNASVPAGRKVIWILGAEGKISEYDANDFHPWLTGLALPAGAREHPENISISHTGTVIYADTVAGTHIRRIWSSNHAQELTGGAQETRPTNDGGSIETWATPVVYFSGDGTRIYWFENRMTVTSREGQGNISREGEFVSWTTDLRGEYSQPVVKVAFAACRCETGACEETCPEISAWAPDTGVSNFFFLTRWVPGQLESDYQETDLYRWANGTWSAQRIAEPIEDLLDAIDGGNSYIGAIRDSGCCGWVNESDDVAYVVRSGKPTTFFDERARYHNDDYDVSFFAANARFSPNLDQLAYTVAATSEADKEIRLADQGKPNPKELARIRAELRDLPKVEVVAFSDISKVSLELAQSELIGWLDQRRLLVLQRRQLMVLDAASGETKPTGLTAERRACVFIR